MTKLVERVAVNRFKKEIEDTRWNLDSALMGGIPGKGVDDAAHNLRVLLGKPKAKQKLSIVFAEISCGQRSEQSYLIAEPCHGSSACMRTLMGRLNLENNPQLPSHSREA